MREPPVAGEAISMGSRPAALGPRSSGGLRWRTPVAVAGQRSTKLRGTGGRRLPFPVVLFLSVFMKHFRRSRQSLCASRTTSHYLPVRLT